jgi:hypothetical protein
MIAAPALPPARIVGRATASAWIHAGARPSEGRRRPRSRLERLQLIWKRLDDLVLR